MEDPDSPWSEVATTDASPTPVTMMVHDQDGILRHMVRGQELLSGHLDILMPQMPKQANPVGKASKGTGADPEARVNLMIAHWKAFANRLLRKLSRKHMFKVLRVERRRRAIVMRENIARRTLIHANPQYGLFRPIDIYDDSQSEEEATGSVAPAASDASTAAPGPGYQPPLTIGRALDV